MAKKKDTGGIVEALREAVADAEKRGITRYQVAKAAGVAQSQLVHLMANDPEKARVPRLDTAQKIAAGAGFRFVLERINSKPDN